MLCGFTQPRGQDQRNIAHVKMHAQHQSSKTPHHSLHPRPTTRSTYFRHAAAKKSRSDSLPSCRTRAAKPRRPGAVGPPLRSLRRSPATRIGAPRAGAPDSLSAARRATGDFGRPLVPLRPKTSMTRASAPRVGFIRVCRVDALAPRIPCQYFDKPTSAFACRLRATFGPAARSPQAGEPCGLVSLRTDPAPPSPASTISALAREWVLG